MAVWVEEMGVDNFKVCLREVKIFDGLHKSIRIVSEFTDVRALFFCRLIIILIETWYLYFLAAKTACKARRQALFFT